MKAAKKATGNVLVANETPEQQLARAYGYPYPRPSTSFLFAGESVLTFNNADWRGVQGLADLPVQVVDGSNKSGREAVEQLGVRLEPWMADEQHWSAILAIGSNAGPAQLRRKFPAEMFPGAVLVPVVQAVLEDFDVVYSPYLSTYGSCTATLEHSPGTAVGVFVTFLTAPLARRMHETEGGYDLLRLQGVRLHLGASLTDFRDSNSHHTVVSSVLQYNHAKGTLLLPVQGSTGETPVALADIPAVGRRFPAATQPSMLAALRTALSPAGSAPAPKDAPLQPVPLDTVQGTAGRPPAGNTNTATTTAASGPPRERLGAGGERLAPASAAGNSAAASRSHETSVGSRDDDGGGDCVSSGLVPELDAWVLQAIRDHAVRRSYLHRLEQHRRPFSYPDAHVVMQLGPGLGNVPSGAKGSGNTA